MKHIRWIACSLAMVFLSGCFQEKTVIRVNPDGSGTVEEQMLLSKKLVAQLEEMMKGFGGEGDDTKAKPMELFEPAKLKEQARKMGQGVTYRSGKKVETADYTGYTATFAFTDISKLKISQQSGDALGDTGGKDDGSTPVTFRFAKGTPATLTVIMPKEKKAEAPKDKVATATATPAAPDAPGEMDEETRKMMELFLGMRYTLEVEVNGSVVSSNATHRDGKRITLVDFDLAKLGEMAAKMEKLNKLKGGLFDDPRALVKEFPGLKMELNDKLTVVFRK
jgi:hypothetical protein